MEKDVINPFLTDMLHKEGRPAAACYLCHAQLVNCHKLMLKAAAAENILQDLLKKCPKVTVNTVSNIDRHTSGLISSLTISRPEVIENQPDEEQEGETVERVESEEGKFGNGACVRPQVSRDFEEVIISSEGESSDQETKVPISSTTQRKKEKITGFCFYCEKNVTDFGKHVLRKHKTEPEVQTILSYPEKSSFRKYLFNDLLKKGEYITNISCVKTKEPECLQCQICRRNFPKNQFREHKESCQVSNTTQVDITNTQSQTSIPQISETVQETKRKRGRPPKSQVSEKPVNTQVETEPIVANINCHTQEISTTALFDTESDPEQTQTRLSETETREKPQNVPPIQTEYVQETIKRKRGRPRKQIPNSELIKQISDIVQDLNIKRKRGRPRKQRISSHPEFDTSNLASKTDQTPN